MGELFYGYYSISNAIMQEGNGSQGEFLELAMGDRMGWILSKSISNKKAPEGCFFRQ
jgi:hypothetical protein